MAKAKKITKEELEKATKASQEYNSVVQAIGNLELQKQDFILRAAESRASIEKLKKGLVQEILEHFKDRNNWRIDND